MGVTSISEARFKKFGGESPIWQTPSGTLGNIFNKSLDNISITLSAYDPEGKNIYYSLIEGSLPPGLSLSNSGIISGSTSSVLSDTLYNFTVQASDGSSISNRAFSLTVKTAVIQNFTSLGTSVWTAPSNCKKVQVLVIGGGAGGAGGGGGAGGFIEVSDYIVTPGNPYTVTVGAGGNGSATGGSSNAGSGGDSVFDILIAKGGGGGGKFGVTGSSGGCGGGAGHDPGAAIGGSSNQLSSFGAYSNIGFGFNGGKGSTGTGWTSGSGGGGAGAIGDGGVTTTDNARGANGGIGRTSTITGTSLYYCGGGGGGANTDSNTPGGGTGGLGGGGNGGASNNASGLNASYYGSGGGGGEYHGTGGSGYQGIVILKF